jgi:surface protein
MSSLFSAKYSFNGDISQWNVSIVTNMEGMFVGCFNFNQD